MTRYFVLAFPELADADRERIEAVRRAHDPQAGLVAAHITLVFNVALDDPAPLQAHVAAVAAATAACDILFDDCRVWSERDSADRYLFLMPDPAGEARLHSLHAHLHGGAPAAVQATMRPYRPHITLARRNDDEESALQALRDRLTTSLTPFTAHLDALTVVALSGDRISTVSRHELKGAGGGGDT